MNLPLRTATGAAPARARARLKLSADAFVRLWGLHAWTGVLASLVLYVMFVTGGLTLFHESFETWEEPLAQRHVRASCLQRTLTEALGVLGETPAEFWFFPPKSALVRAASGHAELLPVDGFEPSAGAVQLSRPEAQGFRTYWLDSSLARATPRSDVESARLVAERERLAHFIYELHFLWHDATGVWLYTIAGLLAVALLLALITGTLIHLQDLPRQFFRFRPRATARVRWTDLHKVLGVMGLPFSLFYAYSGAFLVLAPLLLPLFNATVFGDREHAPLSWAEAAPLAAEAGDAVSVQSLDELVRIAAAALPASRPEFLRLLHHGRSHGLLEVWGHTQVSPAALTVVRVREQDGVLLSMQPDVNTRGAAFAASRWIRGLHFADLGGLSTRFLLSLLALATSATMLSGNAVWLARRAQSASNRVLARLTVGVGAGLWVALGALLVASRTLPLSWHARGTAEELIFLGTLAACLFWSLRAKRPERVWFHALGLAGTLWAITPLLARAVSPAGVFGAGPRIVTVVAVDLGFLITGVLLCTCAVRLRVRDVRAATATRESLASASPPPARLKHVPNSEGPLDA